MAYEVASYFELTLVEARALACEVGKVVETWRKKAKSVGLTDAEIDRMSSAFEHRCCFPDHSRDFARINPFIGDAHATTASLG